MVTNSKNDIKKQSDDTYIQFNENTIDVTIDAFHHGNFFLVQPKKVGHRSGIDAMLLAASVPENFSGLLADFGSGVGAAGLAVAARCPKAQITLIENAPLMLHCAKKTLTLKKNEKLTNRITLIDADINLKNTITSQKNIRPNSFDYIIMNPPFNNPQSNVSQDPLRVKAHVMTQNLFENWISTAATLLKAKGKVSIIARPACLNEILSAMHKRFANIEIIPILPTPLDSAIRIIIRAQHNSRAPTTIKPAIILRQTNDDKLNDKIEKLCNGLMPL